jgi:hypothetical protein
MQLLKNNYAEAIEESIARISSHQVDCLNGLPGMSSAKNRSFFNQLIPAVAKKANRAGELNYLEIGVYKGSTFVSALYNNLEFLKSAVAIDNFCEFKGTEEEFISNLKSFSIPSDRYKLINEDCFQVSTENLLNYTQGPVDIYFYDGGHNYDDHLAALTYYYPVLAKTFILIVDDFNWIDVAKGTYDAIHECNLMITYQTILPSARHEDKDRHWNGVGVFVLSKS